MLSDAQEAEAHQNHQSLITQRFDNWWQLVLGVGTSEFSKSCHILVMLGYDLGTRLFLLSHFGRGREAKAVVCDWYYMPPLVVLCTS